MSYLLKYSIEPLTPEQERDLIKTAQSDSSESDSAIDKILRSNIKLLYKLARELQPCGLTDEDLVAEGTSGLVYAIGKFDLNQEVRFNTYAAWWVKQKMRIAIQNQGKTIRVPAKANVQRARLLHANEELQNILGHEPSVAELAEYTEMPEPQVRTLLFAPGFDTRTQRKDDSDEEPQSIEEVLQDFSIESFVDNIERREQRQKLEKAWNRLSQRDKYILGLRFGLDGHPPRTLEETAQEVGRCRERVRQLEARAIAALKKKLV